MSIISLMKADDPIIEQPKELGKLLRKLLLPFGGGEFFLNPEEKQMFLLDLTLPAENETGVNFDLRMAYAVARLALDHGLPEVCFGVWVESGFDFEQVLTASGYAQLRELPGVKFVDLRQCQTLRRDTDTALTLDAVDVYAPLVQADIIISLAKFKAAEGKLFGGALHNVSYGGELPLDADFSHQQRGLIDLYSILAPDLTIVDGLIGDSHFQPQTESFVLAAADAVAADAVLSAIAGIDLQDVEYLQLAAQYGLGVGEPNDIRVYGDDLNQIMAD